MGQSKIEWTDYTWNPMSGCQKISPGCKNCYAERIYKKHYPLQDFNNIVLHGERLINHPFPANPSRKIFIGSMSDIMLAPFSYLADIFSLILQPKYKNHSFQILTKRPETMIQFSNDNLADAICRNVWYGISCENQEWADKRIPLLLSSSFMIRWISCEPLLGPIDLSQYICSLDWVVVGGETGPGARPMHPDWVRSIRDLCIARGIPFFFKSWGDWIPIDQANHISQTKSITRLNEDGQTRYVRLGMGHAGRLLDGQEWNQFPIHKE